MDNRYDLTHNLERFANIDNLSQKILIANDDIDYSTSTVKHIKRFFINRIFRHQLKNVIKSQKDNIET